MADGVSPVVDTNLGPPPAAQANPIASAGGIVGVMSDLAEMRNRQNANILFQQQMSARHQLGQDLAVWSSQGLSPQEQIDRASHQIYAPLVVPELGSLRASSLAGIQATQTQAQTEEIQQRIANTGLERLTQALAATGGDASKFPDAFKSASAGLPSAAQASMAKSYKAIQTALTANLPADPDAAKAEVASRTRNLGVAFGLPLDKAYAMTGGVAPTTMELPGAQGQTNKAIVSGGGAGPTSATLLGTGPTTAQQEVMKIKGLQDAGLPPSFQTIKTASGAEQPVILSGGGGGAPGTASPILAGGGPNGAPVVGPSLTNAKYNTDVGTDMASYKQNLDDRVKTGAQILQTVTPAWEAIQDLKKVGQTPGGLSSAKMAIAQIAQGLGAAPATVDKIIKLDDAQEISKLMVNTTMAQITQQLPATSKVAVSEFNAFTKNNPNLDTDPRAIEKIFNFWSKVQGVNRVEQSELNKYVAAGGNIAEWPEKWQQIAQERGYVNPNPTGTGGSKPRPPIESFFK